MSSTPHYDLRNMSWNEMYERALFHLQFAKEKIAEHTRFSALYKLISLSPMIVWLLLFQFCKYIPPANRPHIDTHTLPTAENWLLFDHSLQQWPRNSVSDTDHGEAFKSFLDVLAALVYIIHFGLVWVFCIGLYLYWRKKSTRNGEPIPQPWTFFWCFGILNFTAVVTQLSWPTAPPWYPEVYGNVPASYSMSGSAAGLIKADKMLGFPLFTNIYGQSPIVFGSFPSLHAAWPLIITIFLPPIKILKVIGALYVMWVWWAAMYLNHHFFIDVLGGGIYVIFAYLFGLATQELIKRALKEKIYSKGVFRFIKMTRNDIELGFFDEPEEEEEDHYSSSSSSLGYNNKNNNNQYAMSALPPKRLPPFIATGTSSNSSSNSGSSSSSSPLRSSYNSSNNAASVNSKFFSSQPVQDI